MSTIARRLILIDPTEDRRAFLAQRLSAQGYSVDETADAATGADLALRSPPDVVVADLWMPSISGVQLCRLLRSEPGTADVPVVLCGESDEPRNRFWAEHAGATAYVVKGRMSELVRAIGTAVATRTEPDRFFVQLAGGSVDIRDRIARHLDNALFDSVIAAELRALASAGSFERLFDQLSQFMSRVARYRWIALSAPSPARLAIHYHPSSREAAELEARQALSAPEDVTVIRVEDEDAEAGTADLAPILSQIAFGGVTVARFALSPLVSHEQEAASLTKIVARELGGAVKIAALVEDSQRLAATDALTGLMNRRAFLAAIGSELARCERHGYPLSFVLLDVDHFKKINDERGHTSGDRVLAALGRLLGTHLRASDLVARWGGEEFVAAFTSTDLAHARLGAERLRHAIATMIVEDERGDRIPVTASVGLGALRAGESLEALTNRADTAMYAAKAAGRNRVCVSDDDTDVHLPNLLRIA